MLLVVVFLTALNSKAAKVKFSHLVMRLFPCYLGQHIENNPSFLDIVIGICIFKFHFLNIESYFINNKALCYLKDTL